MFLKLCYFYSRRSLSLSLSLSLYLSLSLSHVYVCVCACDKENFGLVRVKHKPYEASYSKPIQTSFLEVTPKLGHIKRKRISEISNKTRPSLSVKIYQNEFSRNLFKI